MAAWGPLVLLDLLTTLRVLTSPFSQVAIIAGNFELAEVIKTHKDADVGEFCPPTGPVRCGFVWVFKAVVACQGPPSVSPGLLAPADVGDMPQKGPMFRVKSMVSQASTGLRVGLRVRVCVFLLDPRKGHLGAQGCGSHCSSEYECIQEAIACS